MIFWVFVSIVFNSFCVFSSSSLIFSSLAFRMFKSVWVANPVRSENACDNQCLFFLDKICICGGLVGWLSSWSIFMVVVLLVVVSILLAVGCAVNCSWLSIVSGSPGTEGWLLLSIPFLVRIASSHGCSSGWSCTAWSWTGCCVF